MREKFITDKKMDLNAKDDNNNYIEDNSYRREVDEYLEAVLKIGKAMVQCGAEIWRVENAIKRILTAYGVNKMEIYGSTTLILVTIKLDNGLIVTQSIRVLSVSNNLGALEEVNALSRYICTNTPKVSDMKKLLDEIKTEKKMGLYNASGYIIAAFSFSIFFGGNLRDGLVAGAIGLIIFAMEKLLANQNIDILIYTLVMNIFTGCLSIFSVKIGIGVNSDKIIIGTVMLFIAALSLVNGVKDMFNRDIVSGISRVVEAVLVGAAIAMGISVAIVFMGVWL